MTRTAEIKSPLQVRRTIAEISVERIAKAAAESSKRHTAQFTNLAALARSIQKYIPAGATRQKKDFEGLARTLVDCAEFYKDRAIAEDVFFSLIATDTLDLLDPDVRADVLRRAEASKSSNVKRTVAATQSATVRYWQSTSHGITHTGSRGDWRCWPMAIFGMAWQKYRNTALMLPAPFMRRPAFHYASGRGADRWCWA